MAKSERLFCAKPFEWFEVTQLNGRGGVYLCCPSWLDAPAGNLRHQSVAEIWNGATAQAIRRSILDGSFEFCNRARCPYLQTRTGPVQRVADVEDEGLRHVIENGLTVLPRGPRKIICTYDQSCNLSCPTCRTHLIMERAHAREILHIQHKLQDEALQEADFLHMTGSGDPFASPYFRAWLQGMKRRDAPRLEWIHLHTNALLWTPKMWGSIPADVRRLVKSAEISIDAATPETYAVNRRGGDFRKLLRNLEFIRRLRRQGPLTFVKISMVVQENNFREMPDFVRLGERLGFDQVYFSQLVNWGTFTEAELRRRAVHLPAHPRHAELVGLLQDPLFGAPIVDLGNLTAARDSVRSGPAAGIRRAPAKLWRKVRARVAPGSRRG